MSKSYLGMPGGITYLESLLRANKTKTENPTSAQGSVNLIWAFLINFHAKNVFFDASNRIEERIFEILQQIELKVNIPSWSQFGTRENESIGRRKTAI